MKKQAKMCRWNFGWQKERRVKRTKTIILALNQYIYLRMVLRGQAWHGMFFSSCVDPPREVLITIFALSKRANGTKSTQTAHQPERNI